MDSLDLEVMNACNDWLAQGRRCELATVVKTWGSSPRPVGSMLAIREDGHIVGSVSGGCIEDHLIEQVQLHGLRRTQPELITYGIAADEAHRFGLPCGGTLQLMMEPLSAASLIPELQQRLARRELVLRRLDLHTGQVSLSAGRAGDGLQLSDTVLTTPHGPRWRLLIIGAGQLSRFLVQVACGMDYHVTVCDPREEHRAAWALPEVEVVRAMPDDFVTAMRPDARTAVVALTHDPKLDDLALMEALRSQAFYVGAIGSRANNARRRERLRQFDLSAAQVNRLHGPVGLPIGSRTPAEIAISILAQLTSLKNGIDMRSAG